MSHQEIITATTPHGDEQRAIYADEQATLELVKSLREEANDYRKDDSCGMSLEEQWETNGQRFLGNHWGAATSSAGLSEGYRVFHHGGESDGGQMGLTKAVLNRTQTALISNVAGQTQQPVVITISPQESADKPDYMLSPDAGRLIAQMAQTAQQAAMQAQALAAQGVDAGAAPDGILTTFTVEQTSGDPEHGPIEPISEQQAQWVQEMVRNAQFPPDALIAVNDSLAAECGQQVFDNRWELGMGDRAVVMNEFLCNVFGHQPIRVQWHDSGEKRNTLSFDNTHVLNVWVDAGHQFIEDAEYLSMDHLLSLDHAKSKWPHLEAELDRAKQSGSLASSDYRRSGAYQTVNYRRDMVLVTTTWLRHQKLSMTEDETLEAGLVVPTEPTVTDVMADDGTVMQHVEPPASPFTLIESGEPTAPDAPNWPTRYGVRQIVTLLEVDKVVDDRPCPYLDIPFAWNVNIPVMYSLYGQGEPQRLEDIQQQVNRYLSLIINYSRYFQFPQRYWKASVLEALKRHGVKIHSRPGANIPIPDVEYDKLVAQGKMCLTQDIVVMPAEYIGVLQLLLAEMDRMSGNVEIRQGVAPSKNMSGEALKTLQAESHGPLAFKSKFTEWMVERIAALAMDAIVRWMDEEVWQEILDRYSLPVIRMVRKRLEAKRYNFRAEISTGRGASQDQTEQRAMALYEKRLISAKTAREKMRVEDPEEEDRRLMQEGMAQAGAQQTQEAAK